MDVLKPCALSSHEPAARCRARGSTAPRLQSCCQVSGVKQVSGPGSEGCWWTGAACRQAGTGRGPVGWQCQSSPQERHVVSEPVSEPVSPWCPLLASRTHHSRESMGLRGEQGTLFCPWQACSGVPSGFSMEHGDTHPASWWHWPVPRGVGTNSPGHPLGLGSLPQSSPSLSQSHSGWEPLRTSLPFGGERRLPSDLTFFPWASSCASARDLGLWWSPRVPHLSPPHMWQFLFCRCSRVCSNVAPRCSYEPC